MALHSWHPSDSKVYYLVQAEEAVKLQRVVTSSEHVKMIYVCHKQFVKDKTFFRKIKHKDRQQVWNPCCYSEASCVKKGSKQN